MVRFAAKTINQSIDVTIFKVATIWIHEVICDKLIDLNMSAINHVVM